jgi:hypothetical protein
LAHAEGDESPSLLNDQPLPAVCLGVPGQVERKGHCASPFSICTFSQIAQHNKAKDARRFREWHHNKISAVVLMARGEVGFAGNGRK